MTPHRAPADLRAWSHARRPWYAAPLLAVKTVAAVFLALKDNRLALLIPVAAVLVAVALLLWFVNLVSPLAPFVYSLF